MVIIYNFTLSIQNRSQIMINVYLASVLYD